jgi:acetyl esterase/lipase
MRIKHLPIGKNTTRNPRQQKAEVLEANPDVSAIGAEVERDILFRDCDGWDSLLSRMDIYFREGNSGRPVLIFIHGGGWVQGDKEAILLNQRLISFFLDRGFVLASINHRLIDDSRSPGTSYREQAEDIAKAMRWLSDHAGSYGGEGDQLYLFGYSSGAYLASLVGTNADYMWREQLAISVLRAVIAVDAHSYDIPLALELMQGSSIEKNIPFIETIFGRSRAEQQQASPVSYVGSTRVPFLLFSAGYKDGAEQSISQKVSEHFKNKLIVSGHKALHIFYPDLMHHSLVLDFGKPADRMQVAVDRFIQQISTDSK